MSVYFYSSYLVGCRRKETIIRGWDIKVIALEESGSVIHTEGETCWQGKQWEARDALDGKETRSSNAERGSKFSTPARKAKSSVTQRT